MNSCFQTIITSLVTGGSVAAILSFVQFLIKRRDEKKDKSSGIRAAQAKQGKQLDDLTQLVRDGNEKQEKTQKQLDTHGSAIAGLEHDRILHICKGYLKQGHISLEDYDDINKYLYEPYQKLGGNGTAKDVMERLKTIVEREEKE